ncbi:MAG TPA: hypothetical protein ENN31_01415 [Candidatus Vogelbacteria bacterium]|nr:hypothetical protein [Candidatus Vogelbacteria bacterium]
MKTFQKIYFALIVFLINFLSFRFSLADEEPPRIGEDAGGGGVALQNPLKAESFAGFIQEILSIVVRVGLPMIVIFMMYVGFLFIKARGNEQELTKAKTAFVYAVIGAALILGAWVISVGIANTIRDLGGTS